MESVLTRQYPSISFFPPSEKIFLFFFFSTVGRFFGSESLGRVSCSLPFPLPVTVFWATLCLYLDLGEPFFCFFFFFFCRPDRLEPCPFFSLIELAPTSVFTAIHALFRAFPRFFSLRRSFVLLAQPSSKSVQAGIRSSFSLRKPDFGL